MKKKRVLQMNASEVDGRNQTVWKDGVLHQGIWVPA
jgi:hypothetical protein